VTALVIAAVGSVTAVGEDAPATVGSIITQAQIFGTLPAKRRDGRPAIGAATPIDHGTDGADRIFILAGLAFREAVHRVPFGTEIGLAICLPSEDEDDIPDARLVATVDRWSAESGLRMPADLRRFFRGGRGTFEALAFAKATLDSRDLEAVCVLSADSLVTKPRLLRMLQKGALEIGQRVPGEGAAAVLLSRRIVPDSLAVLAAVGSAGEPCEPTTAAHTREAVATAIRTALDSSRLGRTPLAALVHDLANSTAGREDLAWMQSSDSFAAAEDMAVLAPAFSTGNTGVASGLLSLVTLAFLIGKGTFVGPGLCVLAGPNGRRTALVLAPAPERKAAKK
jgi:hypothetical protein